MQNITGLHVVSEGEEEEGRRRGFEIVATPAMDEGEESFVDCGANWEKVWSDHGAS